MTTSKSPVDFAAAAFQLATLLLAHGTGGFVLTKLLPVSSNRFALRKSSFWMAKMCSTALGRVARSSHLFAVARATSGVPRVAWRSDIFMVER